MWIIGRNSALTLDNKLLLYNTLLKPVWTYGIQVWGTTSDSNLQIIQRFQNKVLRTITNAPWFTPIKYIHNYTRVPYIRDEIKKFSTKHITKLHEHPNVLAIELLDNSLTSRRLKRYHAADLPDRV